MDTLALLCNLHADGPATLQRLRRGGCDSLASLLSLEPDDLSERMEWSDRGAERFLREALLLAERLDDEDVWAPVTQAEGESEEFEEEEFEEEDFEDSESELDEGAAPALSAEASAAQVEDDQDDYDPAQDEDFDEEEDDDDREDVRPGPDAEALEPVLGRWRELDRDEPLAEIRPYAPPSLAAELGAGQTLLAEAGLESLTHERIRRLAALGIRTLEELAAAPSLELSRQLPLAYTRLLRLQFVARRTQQERTGDDPEVLSPRPPGSGGRATSASSGSDGPAGPFA